MAQTEQTNEYRSERKERLAKQKKKNNKKVDPTKVASGVIIAIAVVALLAVSGGILYAYGVPQSIMPALTVDGRTYSVADYGYYYSTVYQNYANQSYQYQQQLGFSLGFDYTKDPASQMTKDETGNDITYADFFKNNVIETLETYNYYLKLAKAENMQLSDENKQVIEETIAETKASADQQQLSVNRLLSYYYGKGVTLKKYRSYLEEQSLVAQYIEKITDDETAAITMDEINAKYDASPDDYQLVDVRIFGFKIDDESNEETTAPEATEPSTEAVESADDTAATDDTAAEPEKEPSKQELLAKEMLDKITDEESFKKLAEEYCAEEEKASYKYDSATLKKGSSKKYITENINAETAEWLFDAERQVGDKTIAVTDSTVFVIMVNKTEYRNETPAVSARHILVSFENVAELMALQDDTAQAPEEATAPETAETAEAAEAAETAENAEGAEQTPETTEATDSTENDPALTEFLNNNNTSYDAKVLVEAYKQTKDILNEYNSGEKTEEAFAALADQYSTDPGSVGEKTLGGGLYTDIERGGMVDEFDAWIFDEARKPGDVEIIKTQFGFHIMYFVGANDEASWIKSIRSSIATEKQKAREEAVEAQITGTATPKTFIDYAAGEALKVIKKLYGIN